MNVKRLFSEFLMTFYSPIKLYRQIAKQGRSDSWFFVLLYGLFYVFGSLWLYFNGYTLFIEPWIKIPEEKYYLVQSFYIIPLVFFSWIAATGIIHVLSRFFNDRRSFDVLLSMTGYSLWVPWYPLIIVDCIHVTPEWLYNLVLLFCIIMILVNTSVAVKVEKKLNYTRAAFLAAIAFVSIGLVLFTFIR